MAGILSWLLGWHWEFLPSFAGATRSAPRSMRKPSPARSSSLLSRDLAREIIKKNKLAELPEFDPVLRGFSPLKSLLALFGIGRDPFSLTPEERVLDAYYDRLTAYAVDKSRVIVIEFQSRDPDLAARVANSIADGYLVLQQNARQRPGEVREAVARRVRSKICARRWRRPNPASRIFAPKSSLFVGTNNTTLSNQQMGELNTQLNNARALKSDAESKARLIREMLQSGKPIEASEVLNSELIRRLSRAARDAARAARRAVVDLARQPSTHQGIEGAACRSRSADPRRSRQDLALAGQRRANRQRQGRGPQRQPRSAEEAGDLRPTARTSSFGRWSAKPRRSAICWNPIWRNIARPRPARISTPRQRTAGSFPAPASPTSRPIRRSCRSC